LPLVIYIIHAVTNKLYRSFRILFSDHPMQDIFIHEKKQRTAFVI
jgi:hypothetical protein